MAQQRAMGSHLAGYGQQTALFVPRIASLGHEVAVSAFYGLQGAPAEWHGHVVYPQGHASYGDDVLAGHARHFKADLVVTLMDVWALGAEPVAELRAAGVRVAQWTPVDCAPLSVADRAVLEESGATPVAMSRFGETQLREAGFDPLYVPHGIDTQVFAPPADAQAVREAMGLGDKFIVMMNSANKDILRKAWPEQMSAFARLYRKHPDARLFAHVPQKMPGGLDLPGVADQMGITKAVLWADQYQLKTGLIKAEMLATTYGAAHLFSGCSAAEGFGLPLMEAQACGVPTVATDWSAMSEVGCGWKVGGEPLWAPLHRAWWRKPSVDQIFRVYEKAYRRDGPYHVKVKAARDHALGYDADRVLADYWAPALKTLEAM